MVGSNKIANRAQLTSAIGILFLTTAFGISILQLFRLGDRVTQMSQQVKSLGVEQKRLIQENSQLRQQAEQLKESNKLLDEAIHLNMNRDYTNSIIKIDQVLQQDPKNVTALYWKAHACYRLNAFSESAELACKSINIDQDYFDPWVVLILDSHKMGQFSYAENCINRVINARIENYSLLFSRTTEWLMLWRQYKNDFVRHENKLRAIQANLGRLGYYHGPIDAQIGLATENAVNKFCSEHGVLKHLSADELLNLLSTSGRQ